MPEFTSSKLEEFYNHVHDGATGRFSGRAAGRSTAYVHTAGNITPKSGPRDGRTVTYTRSKDGSVKFGGPVTSAKLPLRNATTGRINPLPVRAAFKQGLKEIIGKKQDSKRTTLTGPKVVPNGYGGGGSHKVSQTVKTVKTYKGRVISHVSSKGGADRAGFREGG